MNNRYQIMYVLFFLVGALDQRIMLASEQRAVHATYLKKRVKIRPEAPEWSLKEAMGGDIHKERSDDEMAEGEIASDNSSVKAVCSSTADDSFGSSKVADRYNSFDREKLAVLPVIPGIVRASTPPLDGQRDDASQDAFTFGSNLTPTYMMLQPGGGVTETFSKTKAVCDIARTVDMPHVPIDRSSDAKSKRNILSGVQGSVNAALSSSRDEIAAPGCWDRFLSCIGYK